MLRELGDIVEPLAATRHPEIAADEFEYVVADGRALGGGPGAQPFVQLLVEVFGYIAVAALTAAITYLVSK